MLSYAKLLLFRVHAFINEIRGTYLLGEMRKDMLVETGAVWDRKSKKIIMLCGMFGIRDLSNMSEGRFNELLKTSEEENVGV